MYSLYFESSEISSSSSEDFVKFIRGIFNHFLYTNNQIPILIDDEIKSKQLLLEIQNKLESNIHCSFFEKNLLRFSSSEHLLFDKLFNLHKLFKISSLNWNLNGGNTTCNICICIVLGSLVNPSEMIFVITPLLSLESMSSSILETSTESVHEKYNHLTELSKTIIRKLMNLYSQNNLDPIKRFLPVHLLVYPQNFNSLSLLTDDQQHNVSTSGYNNNDNVDVQFLDGDDKLSVKSIQFRGNHKTCRIISICIFPPNFTSIIDMNSKDRKRIEDENNIQKKLKLFFDRSNPWITFPNINLHGFSC